MQYIGVHNRESAKMMSNKVLLYALANAEDNQYGHKCYAVIHGSCPIPDLPGTCESFDALTVAYPVLWPYGRGLFHDKQL
jgi:hypothetical protein